MLQNDLKQSLSNIFCLKNIHLLLTINIKQCGLSIYWMLLQVLNICNFYDGILFLFLSKTYLILTTGHENRLCGFCSLFNSLQDKTIAEGLICHK